MAQARERELERQVAALRIQVEKMAKRRVEKQEEIVQKQEEIVQKQAVIGRKEVELQTLLRENVRLSAAVLQAHACPADSGGRE